MRIRRSLIDLDDLTAEELGLYLRTDAEFEATPPGRLLDGHRRASTCSSSRARARSRRSISRELRLGANVVNLAPKA